jgi:uncharacterized protein (TIGR02246 family)
MNRITRSKLHPVMMALVACALAAAARGAVPPGVPPADEAAIRENVRQMETGWNTKSGALFAKPFAEDADYVVINGMYVRGREAIEKAHQRIFETIFKDSVISLSVKQFRLLRPDVAVVHVNGHNRTRRDGETREWNAILTLVMVKDAGAWKIAAFQNTQVTGT